MTLKTWGYVIVDSLHPIYPSSLAWKRLVLPQETKEMLKAVTASTLRGINKVDGGCSDDSEEFKNNVETKKALKLLEKSTRHKPYDIVDSKGTGSLVLLYGQPGKTLIVEALSR